MEMKRNLISIYKFLSQIFWKELTIEQLEQFRANRDLWIEAGMRFSETFWTEDANILTEKLAVEFAYLFIGPGSHFPPCESVFLEADLETGQLGKMYGQPAVEIKKIIQDWGYEIVTSYHHLPDHLSVELELLANLVCDEITAIEKNEMEKAQLFKQRQLEVLEKHLLRWFDRFEAVVARAAEHEFYPEMIFLASRVLKNHWLELRSGE